MSNDVKLEQAADEAAREAWPSGHDFPEREAFRAGFLAGARRQPKREAVLVTDEMVESALKARVPGGSNVWEWLPQADAWTPHQTARVVMRCALEAALTTPASAVSADDQPQREAVLEAGDIEWLRKELFAAKLLASHQSQKRIERILAALTTPAPAVSTEELERLVAHVREGGPHVLTRPDGAKARCGGPALCRECARDLAMLQQAVSPRTAAQPQREAVLDEANIERVARAMDPPLWADHVETAHMAASPLQVCYARERSLERARLFLTEYAILTTTTAPAVTEDNQALLADMFAKMEEVFAPLPGELSEGDEA